MSWGIQSFQLVWWGTQPLTQAPQDAFTHLVGVPPTNIQTVGATITCSASLPNASYRLQVQGVRLDLFKMPQQTPPSFTLWDKMPSAFADLKSNVANGSKVVPVASRLALVTLASELAPSPNDAETSVRQLVGMTLPFTDGTDFLFQINRRKALANGIELNRLVKWHTERVFVMDFSTGVPVPQQIDLATLTTDVNVIAKSGLQMSAAVQTSTFAEILQETERLCADRKLGALV